MNNTEKNPELERNKAVALRFKKSQGTQDMPAVEKEVLAPNYNRIRGGNFHLAGNARGEGWPEPGMYLRTAFPDRVDVIEHVVAEGDTVGLLFRLTATHAGNLFGIPPTGKKVDVYEIALLRIVNGQMVEGWFMMTKRNCCGSSAQECRCARTAASSHRRRRLPARTAMRSCSGSRPRCRSPGRTAAR